MIDDTISVDDRLAIHELDARYVWAIDHDEVDDWVALFTPDGTFASATVSSGHDELRAFATARADRQQGGSIVNPQHWTNHHLLRRDGQIVRSSCYIVRFAVDVTTGAKDVVTLGTYEDELVQVDGAWFFASRTFTSS